MSSTGKKLALWRKHTTEVLEIALRDDDSNDDNIVND